MSFLSALILVLPGSFLSAPRSLNESAFARFETWGYMPALLFAVVGIATALAGRGLLRRRRWAWWFAVAVFAMNIVGDIISLASTHDLMRRGLGVVVAGALLMCLLRRDVRDYYA